MVAIGLDSEDFPELKTRVNFNLIKIKNNGNGFLIYQFNFYHKSQVFWSSRHFERSTLSLFNAKNFDK